MARRRTWFLFAAIAIPLLLFFNVLLGEWWIRARTEALGHRTLGVPVTIGTVRLGLWPARAVLHDVRIANPDGFTSPYALHAQRLTATFQWMDILSPPHVLRALQVEGLHLTIEGTTAKNNWTILYRRWQGSPPASPTGPPQVSAASHQQAQAFLLQQVRILDPLITVRLRGSSFETAADAIRLKTMEWPREAGTGGMTLEYAVQQVAAGFLQQTSTRFQLLPTEKTPLQ